MGHSTLTLKMGLGWPRGGRDPPKPLSAGDAGSSSALPRRTVSVRGSENPHSRRKDSHWCGGVGKSKNNKRRSSVAR